MQSTNVAVTFGLRIKQLREARGWRQDELAQRLGSALGKKIDPTTITRLEGGKRPVPLEEAVILAEMFGTDLNQLTAAEEHPLVGRILREQALARQLQTEAASLAARHNEAVKQALDATKRIKIAGLLASWLETGSKREFSQAVYPLLDMTEEHILPMLRDAGFTDDTLRTAVERAKADALRERDASGTEPEITYSRSLIDYLLEASPHPGNVPTESDDDA